MELVNYFPNGIVNDINSYLIFPPIVLGIGPDIPSNFYKQIYNVYPSIFIQGLVERHLNKYGPLITERNNIIIVSRYIVREMIAAGKNPYTIMDHLRYILESYPQLVTIHGFSSWTPMYVNWTINTIKDLPFRAFELQLLTCHSSLPNKWNPESHTNYT